MFFRVEYRREELSILRVFPSVPSDIRDEDWARDEGAEVEGVETANEWRRTRVIDSYEVETLFWLDALYKNMQASGSSPSLVSIFNPRDLYL